MSKYQSLSARWPKEIKVSFYSFFIYSIFKPTRTRIDALAQTDVCTLHCHAILSLPYIPAKISSAYKYFYIKKLVANKEEVCTRINSDTATPTRTNMRASGHLHTHRHTHTHNLYTHAHTQFAHTHAHTHNYTNIGQ
jgi:hypothetical protein